MSFQRVSKNRLFDTDFRYDDALKGEPIYLLRGKISFDSKRFFIIIN